MSKHIMDPDRKTIYVYSDDGEFMWSLNTDFPGMRFGIQKDKNICGYKFKIHDDGSCSFMYTEDCNYE